MAAKNDTKNVSIVDEPKIVAKPKTPAPKGYEAEVIASTFQKFRYSRMHRDGAWENFDGLTLVEYINESVRRFITNVDARDDIEDWQARVHDGMTRNKVLATLSKIVQVLPIAEFNGRGDEDFRKAQILTDLYQYSEDVDDYEELLINTLLECILKGTAISYEGQERKVQAIRNVKGSGDDMTIETGEKRINRLYGSLVPLEDFYPSNIGIRRIKDMPFCFWRSSIPFQQFLQDFAMFGRSADVQPKVSWSGEIEDRPYYLDFISDDVVEGMVEVIRYYNKDTDEYVLLANGIWLNALMQAGQLVVSPLPFTHKELPFWDIRFELFPNFFYGKSLPDKLKSYQDVLNVLTNMLLDQSFLTIFPPILTSGFDSIEDDYLRPGRRTPVDTQGGSLQEQYMKLDMGTPTGWHEFILNYTRKVMEEASMDQVQSGVAGVGGRTTAQEIDTASAGVSAMLGLFGRLIKYGLRRKALLRAKNILQFWTEESSPIIEQILGEGGTKKVNKAFNIIKVDNTVLTSGQRGLKIIEMYANPSDKPTKKQLETRKMLAQADMGKNIEVVAMDADYIRNFEFDVKLVINTKSEDSKDQQKLQQLEKTRIYMSFFPDIIDKAELAAQTMEKLGDDPMKLILPSAVQSSLGLSQDQQKQQDAAAGQMKDGGMNTLPQGTLPNQALQKAMGKQLQGRDAQMLQQQMVG